MLQDLRFVQSADTMFIASGKYPVKQLARYSDTDWRFADFEITDMYFDESTSLENYSGISYTVPGTYHFQPTVTGEYQIDIAGAGGGGGGGVKYSKPSNHGHHYYCVGGGAGGNGERIIKQSRCLKIQVIRSQSVAAALAEAAKVVTEQPLVAAMAAIVRHAAWLAEAARAAVVVAVNLLTAVIKAQGARKARHTAQVVAVSAVLQALNIKTIAARQALMAG